MADKEQLALLRQGAGAWNAWRQEYLEKYGLDSGVDLEGARFSGANLRAFNLSGADLNVADLVGADLLGAYLNFADLSGTCLGGAILSAAALRSADLSRADLRGAHLGEADLSEADLRMADLRMADLSRADLRGADLEGADLGEAKLYETILGNVHLSNCKGLESCVHYHGPSTIDYRTLQRSGPLPLAFLRGVGLPDILIKQLPRLVGPAQFHNCFICHSSQDSKFVGQLYNDLRERGVLCWYSPEEMKAGGRILDTVHKVIGEHQKVLVILSAASIASEWVEREVKRALAEERSSGRDILVPICIDDAIFTTGEAWAVTLRDDRYIADFRPKVPDAYRKNLDRLLDDLKVEAADPSPAG